MLWVRVLGCPTSTLFRCILLEFRGLSIHPAPTKFAFDGLSASFVLDGLRVRPRVGS